MIATPTNTGMNAKGEGGRLWSFFLSVGGDALRDVSRETSGELKQSLERKTIGEVYAGLTLRYDSDFEFFGDAARDLIAEYEANEFAGEATFEIRYAGSVFFSSDLQFESLKFGTVALEDGSIQEGVSISGTASNIEFLFRQKQDTPVLLTSPEDITIRPAAYFLEYSRQASADNRETDPLSVDESTPFVLPEFNILGAQEFETSQAETFFYPGQTRSTTYALPANPTSKFFFSPAVPFPEPTTPYIATGTIYISGEVVPDASVSDLEAKVVVTTIARDPTSGNDFLVLQTTDLLFSRSGADTSAFTFDDSASFSHSVTPTTGGLLPPEDFRTFIEIEFSFSAGAFDIADLKFEDAAGANFSSFSFREEKESPEQIVKAFRAYDAVRQIVEGITGVAGSFKSDFLDTGFGKDWYITYGFFLRKQDSRPFSPSFKDLFIDGLARMWNLSYGIEEIAGQKTIVCEPLEYFFNTAETVALTDYNLAEVLPNLDIVFSTFEIGFETWETETQAGFETVNAKAVFRPVGAGVENIGKKFQAISKLVLSSPAISLVTELADKPRQDAKNNFDEKIFLIDTYTESGSELDREINISGTFSTSGITLLTDQYPDDIDETENITVSGTDSNDGTYSIIGKTPIGSGASLFILEVSPTPVAESFDVFTLAYTALAIPVSRRQEGITSVSGLADPEKIHNLRLNTQAISDRYKSVLRGTSLEAVKTEGANGWSIEYGGNTFTEGDDIALPQTFGGGRLFGKYGVVIETTQLSATQVQDILASPQDYIFTVNAFPAGEITCFAKKITYNANEGTARIELIQKEA